MVKNFQMSLLGADIEIHCLLGTVFAILFDRKLEHNKLHLHSLLMQFGLSLLFVQHKHMLADCQRKPDSCSLPAPRLKSYLKKRMLELPECNASVLFPQPFLMIMPRNQ
jgi:hypothetical protein